MGRRLPELITKEQFAISTLLNQIATTSLPTQSTLYVVDPAVAAGVVVAVVGGVVDVVLCHTYVLLVMRRSGATQFSKSDTLRSIIELPILNGSLSS